MRSLLALTFLLFLYNSGLHAQAVIEVNNFERYEEDLNLLGSANFENELLRLTPASAGQTGASWYSREQIDLNTGFDTEFEFRITGAGGAKSGGDGMAFVIQDLGAEAIGKGGAGIGYGGLTNALVIEFDTYDNGDEGSRNHVSLLYYDSERKDFKRHATVHSIPELIDGEPHWGRMEYKDGFLTFYLDDPRFPTLSSRVDIAEIIGDTDGLAWMGFTASTSDSWANHDLLKWTFNKKVAPPEDIREEEVKVDVKHTIEVQGRKLKIRVWDNGNLIDGDIISLKAGDDWLLTGYKLREEKFTVDYSMTGFSSIMVVYANNLGSNPPNTAAIEIFDGKKTHFFEMRSDMKSSEALEIRYVGD